MVVKGPALSVGGPEKLGRITGVTAVSRLLRDSVTLLDGTLGQSVDLLAVDLRSLDTTAWFRDDFYPGGLPAISRLLRPRPFPSSLAGTGIPLPEDSVSIGIWVDSSDLFEKNLQFGVNMWARVMTAEGIYRTFAMGNILEAEGPDATDVEAVDGNWRLLTGDLPTLGQATPPFELVSVFFSTTPSNRLSDVIEEFEGSAPWTALANQGSKPDVTEQVRTGARSGSTGLRFSWEEAFSNGQRGIHLPPGPFPIPAIGGPDFQVGQQLRVKLGSLAVPVQIVGVVTHFPTLSPDRRPFFLTDLTDFTEYTRRLPLSVLAEPAEMWRALDEEADREQVVAEIRELKPGLVSVKDSELAASLAERNPLAGGGWNGLTIFSMVAIGIAVLLTLTVHALVSIRMGRMDLAVVRVLGFSHRQFLLSLAAERLIIAVLAIAAGAAMGYWPGLEILELVDLTPHGGDPVPPLVPSVQGWLMAGVLAGLLAVAALSVAFAVVAARRLNTAEILRGGV